MSERFDAVVVGAGPAGSAAALVLARGGASVCLIERGPFPGSKNMYGGVIYGRVLDELIPKWWEQAPIQRWVTRRCTTMLTGTQALTIDYRTSAWGTPPYNGATAFRPDFDSWLASKAEEAGAVLVCATTVTGLLRNESGEVVGVKTDRPDGDIEARSVIACDGVNSFIAKEAGLYHHGEADHFTLGVKEVISLPRQEIESRFGVRDLDGADYEIVGCTGDIPGGGFIYTNLDSIAVGVVLSLKGLSQSKRRPEEVLGEMKAHPAISPLVEGGEIKEYSAHLIPEGGYEMMPELGQANLLIAGDAAAMCLAAGIWLEGVNFAIGSGAAAGESVLESLKNSRAPVSPLDGYRKRLEASFVLADHRKLRRAPGLVLSERVQTRYPQIACNLAERMFTVTNPSPKKGMMALGREELKRSGVRIRDLAKDAWTGLRTFG